MAEQRRQHLYLVFDDWHSGYSIRKISLSRRSGKRGKQPFLWLVPEVFTRIRAERGFPDMFTSAFVTKIMVMPPALYKDEDEDENEDEDEDNKGVRMIDVQEKALIFGPVPGNRNFCPIYFPVGDNKLFALDIGTFDCYLWTPERRKNPWGWQDLPRPPFKRGDVSSYGMTPDAILVSTVGSARTLILDTTKEKYVWKPYGNWVFPFTGRGHYDTSLRGFVGLSNDGYLCYTTMAASTTGTSPDVKRTKEKVYTERQHVSATLVHMRPGKFCLVECVSVDNERTGQDLKESWVREFKVPLGHAPWECIGGGPQGGRCMYRIRTFNLSYDMEGDCLKLKNCKGQGRCYNLPHEARIGSVCMDPMALWL